MNPLKTPAGATITLGNRIGRGGEAQVFAVVGRSDVVAKVYHSPLEAEHRAKLQWMLAHPPADPTTPRHVSIAWPLEFLLNDTGQATGILISRIADCRPLIQVYNPSQRAKVAPAWTTRHLYRTATNLASVVAALHAADYVIGDLNESNLLVTPDALISVIDTDSFQVKKKAPDSGEVIFRCKVGKPEFTAPELHGTSLDSVTRTRQQDAFGLGVLIFLLLMDGNHPFRIKWIGRDAPPSLEDSISRGYFAYQPTNAPIQPPPHVAGLNSLSPGVQALFRRCFVDGHADPRSRPSADDWVRELTKAERHLVSCPQGHYYPDSNSDCPFCRLRKSVGVSARTVAPPTGGPSSPPAASTTSAGFSPPPPPSSAPNRPYASVSATTQPPPTKSRRKWLWALLGIGAWRWLATRDDSQDAIDPSPFVAPTYVSDIGEEMLIVPSTVLFGARQKELSLDHPGFESENFPGYSRVVNESQYQWIWWDWSIENSRGKSYELGLSLSGAWGDGIVVMILEKTASKAVNALINPAEWTWAIAESNETNSAHDWLTLAPESRISGAQRQLRDVRVRLVSGHISLSINQGSFTQAVSIGSGTLRGTVRVGFGLVNQSAKFTIDVKNFKVAWM
jgi:serine/threonine protein kinase